MNKRRVPIWVGRMRGIERHNGIRFPCLPLLARQMFVISETVNLNLAQILFGATADICTHALTEPECETSKALGKVISED